MVRGPLRVRERSRRTLDMRLALRAPWLVGLYSRFIARRPPTSRLRQTLIRRTARQALEAYNRRDLDVVAAGFHRDLEYHPYREFVEAGLAEPVYRGASGYKEYIDGTREVWGEEVQLKPTELIDLGDRLVVLADMPMRAQGSGIALAESYASVWKLRDGKVVEVRDFLRQSEALAAAGLEG
jgi:ketosteroid isomerase-like protein